MSTFSRFVRPFAFAVAGAFALAGSPATATLQPRTVFAEEFGFYT